MDRVRSIIGTIRRSQPLRGIVGELRSAEGRASVSREGLGASIPRPMQTDILFRWA
jgi:hypothetical protein